jgi:hypothetical protein
MKKNHSLVALLLATSLNLFGQTTCNVVSDDFSNPALWNHPVLGTNLSDPIVYNTINISTGKFVFGQSRDNNMNYMTRSGLSISDNDFKADIDFNFIYNGTLAGGANHTILALNGGTNPFHSDLSNIGGTPGSASPMSLSINSPQKGISVSYESDLPVAPTLFQFKVYLNDGLGIPTSITQVGTPVVIPLSLLASTGSVDLYIRLKRTTTINGILEIYSDVSRTSLIGSSTFSIPASINTLNTVFIGTNERADADNMLTGSLDNLCITNTPTPPTCNFIFDDFSNATLWNHPVLPTTVSCPSVFNTIYIASNKLNFGQSRDNNMNYFYRSIPIVSNSDFKANIDFKHITNGLSAGGAGHTLLALSSSTLPFFNDPATISGGTPCSASTMTFSHTLHNGIAVIFESDLAAAPTYFEFKVYLNNNGFITPGGVGVNVGLANTNYYLSLERIGTTSGLLTVYSDYNRTIPIGNSGIFTIPASISSLNTVSIGTNEWQDHNRMLTGNLKNLCINNTSTSSVDENEITQNNLHVFPNPTTDKITIESMETIQQIEIYNVLGEKVGHKASTSNTVELSLANLEKGIYLIKIVSEKGNFTKQIIKN